MGWYNEAFYRRTPISVPNVAGDATIDVAVTLPPEWDEFWDALDAASDTTGDSIRVTDSNGTTLLNYDLDDGAGGAFDATTRTGRLLIDGVAVAATANTVCCFWIFYDVQGTAAVDASTAVTISSAKTGYIDLGKPTAKNYVVRPLPVGRTTPQIDFAKGSNDSDDVWLSWREWLEFGKVDLLGHRNYEEPKNAVVTAFDSGGGAVTTIYTVTLIRWAEVDGAIWLRVPVTAGTTANNYTVAAKVTTVVPNDSANHRVYQERFGLRVKDVLEAA